MKQKIIIVLDCGATNVRSVAVDDKGVILAEKSYSNKTQADPFYKEGIIWNVDEIWQKLAKATKQVVGEVNKEAIMGITITTFGVDGAPFNKSGKQIYPVISWACQRTNDILDDFYDQISLEKLYKTSGVNHFHFNTIYKLYWLLKNKPEVMVEMDQWLFMPSIIARKICNTLYTDVSMMGTSMLGDLKTRQFSNEILSTLKLSVNHFPPLKEAGEQVGIVSAKASKILGLNEGLPLFSAGHDTQFALFGSGAKENEVVLSSGTWEILMMRTEKVNIKNSFVEKGVTIELDAKLPLFNPGIQWLGSGILEQIKRQLFTDIQDRDDIYDIMIAEAEAVKECKLQIDLDFLNHKSFIQELHLQSSRGEIYLATLNALAEKTKASLKILEDLSGVKVKSLLVVGGGSKNKLWNKIRAKKLGIEVKTNAQTETTVLGAAMFAFGASKVYDSVEQAREYFLK